MDAYTRTRVILMNGMENEVWAYGHHFARSAGDLEIRSLLAQTRMVEQQQQTTINWLNPADQSVLETTIGYEQVAVDLTAYLTRNEPDPYVRAVFNFGLLEDFDYFHCYQNETDPRIRGIWEEFLHMELTHLQRWGDLLRHCEGVEPEVLFGEEIRADFKFTENKEYVRQVLQQRDLRLMPGGAWTTQDQLPPDWPSLRYLETVNAGGIPSEQIVQRQQQRGRQGQRPGDELLQRAREVAEHLAPVGTRVGGK